jgi:hypothetical protein
VDHVHGVERRQGEPCVAADDGRDAVQVGRRRRRVPEQLGVVVGVRVDDARRHHQAAGVELDRPLAVDVADGRDDPVPDADVGPEPRRAGAVDHGAAADHVVELGRSRI